MDNHLVLPPLNYDPDIVGDIGAVGGSTMEQSIASSVDENLKFFDIGRAIELNRAKQKATPVYDDYIDPYSGESYPDPSKEIPRKMLPAEEANRKYGIPENGLTFNEPITEEAARILNTRKKQEVYNQEIIAQAQGWNAVGGFTMGIIASLAQPEQFALNILGGIVAKPILGAKYAAETIAALSPMARIGARGVAGGIEGTTGALLAEPIQMKVAAEEYADYDLMDTLANIAGGTVLGGGLHIVGGTTADWMKGLSKTTWSQGLDAAVAQLINGKQVEVEPIIRQDPSAILKAEMQAMMMPGEPTTTDVAATNVDPSFASKIKEQIAQLPLEINTAESFAALRSVIDSGAVGFRIERDFVDGHSVTIDGKKYVLGDLETGLKILDPAGADKDMYGEAVKNAVSSDFNGDSWKLFKAPKRVVVKYGNQFLIINGKELLSLEQGANFSDMSVGLAVKLFEKYSVLVSFSEYTSAKQYDGKGVMLGEVYEGVPTGIDVVDRKSASQTLYSDIVSFFHSQPNGFNSVPNQLSVDVAHWLDQNKPVNTDGAFFTGTKDVAKIPDEMIAALAGGSISDNPPVKSMPTDLLISNLQPLSSSQLGSNEGGKYVDPSTGIKYYVKRNKTNEQTFTEIATNLIYQYLDVVVPPLQRVDFQDGTFGVASVWQVDGNAMSIKEIKATVADLAYDFQRGANPIADPWIVDAWLANWDAFAEGNFIDTFDGGMRIDQGGALEFRAQGEKKTNFGPKVEELESFFTISTTYPKILKEIGITGPKSALASLKYNEFFEAMKRLDASYLSNALLEGGYSPEETNRLTGILVARRDYIIAMAEGKTPNVATGFRVFTALPSVLKYLKKMSEHVHKLLTQEEKDALHNYQGGSGALNSYLRNKDVEGLKTNNDYEKWTNNLDSALAKSPSTEPVTVFRWVESYWFKISDPNEFFKMVGAIYNDRGYGSTSLSIETDYKHRNVVFAINVPQGYGLIPADSHTYNASTHYSHGEQEMVIARNTHYRITAVATLPGGKVRVDMDVLPNKIAKMDLLEAVKKMTEWQTKASSAADTTPSMTEAEVQQLLSEIPGLVKKEVPTLTEKIETQEEKTLKEFVQSIEEFFGESEDRAEFDAIMKEFGVIEKESNEYAAAMRKATNCYLGA